VGIGKFYSLGGKSVNIRCQYFALFVEGRYIAISQVISEDVYNIGLPAIVIVNRTIRQTYRGQHAAWYKRTSHRKVVRLLELTAT
jgi:hypothetical protein